MSFIEVMLSRREVVLSLALVAFVLFLALVLAVLPVLRKRWKRMQAQRKARQAAKIAQLKKKKAAAKIAYQKRQAEEAVAIEEPDALEGIDLAPEVPAEATPATAPVVVVQVVPTVAPPAAATASTPAPAEGTTPVAGAPAPFHPEETPAEEEQADGDLQSILDDVFVDEEANARYEVLLRDVEVMTADELVEMATKLNADLRARRNGNPPS